MTTPIALTFDIEFDINGTFIAPETNTPRGMEALVGNDSTQRVGLSRILEILAEQGVKATFFVETAQSAWFGCQEMATAVEHIKGGGHELQLHVHPVWFLFRDPQWRSKISQTPPKSTTHDAFPALSEESALALLDHGISLFQQWGLERPTAVRTGSLFIERDSYRHFASRGLNVSSSVGVGLNLPTDEALRLFQAPRTFEGVLELPVTSYAGCDATFRRTSRLATIIGMGRREQSKLLQAAAHQKLPFLVLLSHASEFYVRTMDGSYRQNLLTEKKLVQLCRSIRDHSEFYDVTISELALQVGPLKPQDDIALTLPKWTSLARYPENLLNRAVG